MFERFDRLCTASTPSVPLASTVVGSGANST